MQVIESPTAATPAAVDSVLQAVMTIGRLMRQRVPSDSLEPGAFVFLKHVQANGSPRLTELATYAGLDVSTVSRHVTHLHRQGLLDRAADPADKRASRVTLSALGEQRLQDAVARRRALLAHALDGWDPTDIDHLDRLLNRFVSGIEGRDAELDSV